MGYYLTQSVTINGYHGNEEWIFGQMKSKYELINEAIDIYGKANYEQKGSITGDIAEFSLQHPQILFTVTVEGEDRHDYSQWHIKNGMYQQCRGKVVYEPMNEKKFKKW